MKKSSILLGLTALVMSSCSSNELDFGGSDMGSKLQVSATINELQSTTRAAGTSWDANDSIGVTDDNNNSNVKFVTTDGSGTFTSDDAIYLLGDETHNFTAYYPYSANITDGKISFTQPVDFMYGTGSATRQNPNVSLTFQHKMSELSFTINNDASQTTTEAGESTTTSTITLHDVILDGTFDTTTGAVTSGTTKGDYTVNFTLGQKTNLILPPQTFEGSKLNVTVNVNDKVYGCDLTLDQSVEGKDIQYQLTLKKDNTATVATVGANTITDWDPVNNGNVDMTEQAAANVLEIGDFLLSDGTVIDKTSDLSSLATGTKVVGVVYYVGNAQPSTLYSSKYTAAQDILKADAPNATNGLAIAIADGNSNTTARLFGNTRKLNYLTDWYNADGNSDAAKYIGTNLNIGSASELFLGYNNTAVIEKVGETYADKATGSAEFTGKLTTFRDANTVTNCSKWYLPSYAEWKQIQDNYTTISASITKAGGDALTQYSDYSADTAGTGKFYWSSDLRSSSYAWVTPLSETSSYLYIGCATNNYKGHFRFAIAF